jgi:hypothetical protein
VSSRLSKSVSSLAIWPRSSAIASLGTAEILAGSLSRSVSVGTDTSFCALAIYLILRPPSVSCIALLAQSEFGWPANVAHRSRSNVLGLDTSHHSAQPRPDIADPIIRPAPQSCHCRGKRRIPRPLRHSDASRRYRRSAQPLRSASR